MLLQEIDQKVRTAITRWAMSPAEAELLMRYAAEGDHLEIGTLWGGSAIGVAMAKRSGEVYCIDPFPEMPQRELPTLAGVEASIKKLGITTIHLYQQAHPPMPSALEDHRFDTALIDGEHTYDACLANWLDIKGRVDRYILFHDIDFEDRVKPVWEIAISDPQWEYVEVAGDMGVVARR